MKTERPVRIFIGVGRDAYEYRMTSAEAGGIFIRAGNYQKKCNGPGAGVVRVTLKQLFKSSDAVIRTEEFFMAKEHEALLREGVEEVQAKSKAQYNEKTRFEKSAKQHGKRVDKQERRLVKKALKQIK